MAGQICLVGGEEFRAGCEDMDREIMQASGQSPRPGTGDPHRGSHGAGQGGQRRGYSLRMLGGDANQLMVLEREHADDPAMCQPSREAHVVYFTGGSPDHLLSHDQRLRIADCTNGINGRWPGVGGSSAGAMVMGSMMRRPRSGGWVEGLGLVPGVAVMPHHENRDPAETSKELQEQGPGGLTVLGIDARTGCLGAPGAWRVVGSGKVTVYRGNDWSVYESGQPLPPEV